MRLRPPALSVARRMLPLAPVLAAAAGAPGQISPWTGHEAPLEVCFAAGTDPAYVERMVELVRLHHAVFGNTDYHADAHWGAGGGVPVTLTWSFVPDGTSITTSGGEPTSPSQLFAKMDAAFAAQGGRAAWINRFQQMFDRWGQLAGVHYTRVTFNGNDWDDGAAWLNSAGLAGHRGDIRISMHPIDGPFNTLAYNYYPPVSDMVMDSDDISYFADGANQNLQLRNTIGHEHGHGLGLGHTCSLNSHVLMEPLQEGGFDGPQQDDIRGAQHNYGDAYEANNTAATATPIGAVTPGVTVGFGSVSVPVGGIAVPNAGALSIDAAGKIDWYSFTTGTALPAVVSVIPMGSTYDNGTQNANGSCPATPANTNGLTQANLAVQVYASNGTTLLGSADNTAAGSTETLALPTLAAGSYRVKVYSVGAQLEPQLYRMTLACPPPAITQAPQAQAASSGGIATFHVAGTNVTTYHWRRNGVPLSEGGHIIGSNTANLTLSPVRTSDAGTYTVSLTNGCGTTITTGVSLTVSCYPNCDDSTAPPILNVSDFTCFIQKFSAGDPWCNCDGSTTDPVLNVYDFICFQQSFAAGCP